MRSDFDMFSLELGLWVDGLWVVSVRGREAMSRPFRFDVAFATPRPTAEVRRALGQPATLRWRTSSTTSRAIHGVVTAVALDGVRPADGAVCARVRVAPRLATLGRRRFSRVFQHRSVPEIVGILLDEASIAYDLELVAEHLPRNYCVQYQETDLAFIERILAEEGIFYWFAHPTVAELVARGRDPLDVRERVVLADAPAYPGIQGDETLSYREHGTHDGVERVHAFDRREAIRAQRAIARTFDFVRPGLDLTQRLGPLESLEEPLAGDDRLAVYEHADDHDAPAVTAASTQRLLEEERRRAVVARGAGDCARFTAGHRFTLAGHALEEMNASWTITSVEHRADVPESGAGASAGYANTFDCVPASVPFRPRRQRRRIQQVVETATVVGARDEEIHVDEHGRIRVQFHWDLDGKRNDHSSCLMRVAQPWAGAGWGSQFIPRVGMEVLVSFLGGDVDRPVVMGALYNAHHPPTHRLPEDKTKSGIRTSSTGSSGGYNEIAFDDAGGSETFSMRAERDMIVRVRHDEDRSVGRDERVSVARDRSVAIDRDDTVSVGGRRSEAVKGDLDVSVRGDHRTIVGGAHHTTVEGVRGLHVAEESEERFDGDADSLYVQGRSTTTGGTERIVVQGDRQVFVFGPIGAMTTAQASFSVSAGSTVVLDAGQSIRLVCGDSAIELLPDEVIVRGKKITLAGEDAVTSRVDDTWLHVEPGAATLDAASIKLHADKASIELGGGKAEIDAKESTKAFGSGASLVLDATAKLGGASVSLGGSASAGNGQSPAPDELATDTVELSLEDHKGRPVPRARWVVETALGRIYSGRLDADGKAKVRIDPGECHVSYAEIDPGAWDKK